MNISDEMSKALYGEGELLNITDQERIAELEKENAQCQELVNDAIELHAVNASIIHQSAKRIAELEAEKDSHSFAGKTLDLLLGARNERIAELEEMTRKLDAEKSSAELTTKTTIEQHKVTLQRIAELNRKAEVRIKILETRIVELEGMNDRLVNTWISPVLAGAMSEKIAQLETALQFANTKILWDEQKEAE
jgi:hypothetical protein